MSAVSLRASHGYLHPYRSSGGGMAHLYRLILVLVLSWSSGSVFASFPATQTNPTACTVAPCYEFYYSYIPSTNSAPTKEGAARKACDYYYPPAGSSAMTYSSNMAGYLGPGWQCGVRNLKESDFLQISVSPTPATYSCPVNSTLSGSSCTCSSGYTESGSSCIAVNNCSSLAGVVAGSYSGLGTTGEKQLCDTAKSSGDAALPNCYMRGLADFAASYGNPPQYHWSAKMTYTGDKCAPSPNGSSSFGGSPSSSPGTTPTANTDNSPTTCPVGKVPGTVNGVTVCVDPGPSTPTQSNTTGTTSVTKPDGTVVSTTENTSTQCTGDACTRTTVTNITTTINGTSTTDTTTTATSCSRLDPSCSANGGGGGGGGGDSSSFGGTCMASFNCSGDAIMCSVAMEQHRRNCALFQDATPESDLYNTEKTKTGAQYTNENVSLGTGAFNSSNALGVSASCVSDKTIVVMGTTIVLPFSNICPTLQHFGTILLFISFLVAYRIVARG